MEKTEILSNYRQVCLENDKLENTAKELAHENQQLFLRYQEGEKGEMQLR
jgi:hypothetical protein